MSKEQEQDCRLGLMLDEKMSEQLLELSRIYKTPPLDLINHAIQTMWQANQRKALNDGE